MLLPRAACLCSRYHGYRRTHSRPVRRDDKEGAQAEGRKPAEGGHPKLLLTVVLWSDVITLISIKWQRTTTT